MSKVDKAAQVRALRETRAARNTREVSGTGRKPPSVKALSSAPEPMTETKRTKGSTSPSGRTTASHREVQPEKGRRNTPAKAGKSKRATSPSKAVASPATPRKRAPKGTFDRKGYMKEYMRKKRAKK